MYIVNKTYDCLIAIVQLICEQSISRAYIAHGRDLVFIEGTMKTHTGVRETTDSYTIKLIIERTISE